MKRMLVFCGAAFAASLAMAQPAPAPLQPDPPRYSHGDHHDHWHHRYQRHERHERRERREWRERHEWREHHRWVRGERLRDHYRGRVVVVRDYRDYRLRRPPRGYHWVRDDDGDFLLVAITTGVIADLLLHSH